MVVVVVVVGFFMYPLLNERTDVIKMKGARPTLQGKFQFTRGSVEKDNVGLLGIYVSAGR